MASASASDLICAEQKDARYRQWLRERLSDLALEAFGTRWHLTYKREISLLADALYLTLTTVAGHQTLGEEYCDIMQRNDSIQTYPSFLKRTGFATCRVLLPYLYEKSRMTLTESISTAKRRRHRASTDSEEAWMSRFTTLQNHLSLVEGISKDVLKPLHLAVFYVFARYHHVSSRLLGVRYMLMRSPSVVDANAGSQGSAYRLLGALLALRVTLLVSLRSVKFVKQYLEARTQRLQQEIPMEEISATPMMAVQPDAREARPVVPDELSKLFSDFLDSDDDDGAELPSSSRLAGSSTSRSYSFQYAANSATDDEADDDFMVLDPAQKCTLCLSRRTNTTATPCGHLFCWKCICEWCQQQQSMTGGRRGGGQECPLCRQSIRPEQLYPIANL